MKKLSFYWNWLARVAKSNSVQRKVVVNTRTTKSKMNGKTAILAVATIIAVALTTQTTGPTAQSAEMPELPDPPPHREVVLPPFPPGAFSNCIEQYYSRLGTIAQGASNWRKRIEEKFDALLDPIDALIDAKRKLIDDLTTKIRRILECYDKWIDWLNEKTQREVNAAWEEYENCAASETNDN